MERSFSRLAAAFLAVAPGACSLTDLGDLSAGVGGSPQAPASSASTGGSTSSSGSTASTASGENANTTTGDGGAGGAGGQNGSGGAGGHTSAGGGGAGGQPPCLDGQLCSLREDFDEALDSTVWGAYGTCARSHAGGRLSLEISSQTYCGHYSRSVYDLVGNAVLLAVPEVTGDEVGVQTLLFVEEGQDLAKVGIIKTGTMLTLELSAVSTVDVAVYDPALHRFWRIAEVEGEIVFSVRATSDGAPWVEIGRATGLDTSALSVVFGVGAYEDVPWPQRGAFDCLNIDPDSCLP